MKHPKCNTCGSDQILLDAYSYWDYEKQSWELLSTYAYFLCHECEGETSITWEEDSNED